MKKIVLNIIIILFYGCSSSYGDENEKKIEKQIPVRTKVLMPRKYVKEIKGTGKIKSAQQANLMFEVPGKIVSVNCKIGDYLEKGDIIASLKNDVYKAKFQLAENALNKANRDLKNIERLFKSNAVSEDEYLNAKLGQNNAKSNFITAKYAFESTDLIAPFSGTVTHINLQIGELFSPAPVPLPPVIISKMDDLQLEANISSKEIMSFKNGQKATIKYPESNTNIELSGVISEVGYVPLTMSNSYKINIDIQNPNEKLRLGMMMNFSVEVSEADSVYMISNRFILKEKNNQFIWSISNDKPKKVYVKISELINDKMIVVGDLYPGIEIITDGLRRVEKESKLRVIE